MSITPINESNASFSPIARIGSSRVIHMAQSGPIERAGDQVLITTRPIRTDLVARVRAQIESGEYETARRLDVAAEAMIRAVSNS